MRKARQRIEQLLVRCEGEMIEPENGLRVNRTMRGTGRPGRRCRVSTSSRPLYAFYFDQVFTWQSDIYFSLRVSDEHGLRITIDVRKIKSDGIS